MLVEAISGGIGILGSVIGAFGAKKKERAARRKADQLTKELNHLEATRQAIVNPYANVKDLSTMAKDLSSMVSNPYANLGVATAATTMQIEQTDQALANTLDALRETGAGAGGATALAMAALKSKQGVTADIEQQEANNEKMKAQGQQQMEQVQMQQAQRLQDIQMSEGQRTQAAETAGSQFVYQAREGREMQKMDRVAGQLSGAQAQQTQAQADFMGAIGAGVSAVAGIGAAAASAKTATTGTSGKDYSNTFKASNYKIN
jgi:hypothetical protein